MSSIQNIEQDVRSLTTEEIDAVSGAGIIINTGCIIISSSQPIPTYNPWLDPYSTERRFG
jgi:hypothetical protein